LSGTLVHPAAGELGAVGRPSAQSIAYANINDMNKKIGLVIFIIMTLTTACGLETVPSPKTVPHEYRWGIYSMELSHQDVTLIYSSAMTISNIRLNNEGTTLVFSMNVGEDTLKGSEIFTIDIDSKQEIRLTNNDYLDTYPVWSPDGKQIAYLSWPHSTLDIFLMDNEGKNSHLLYDSGYHDADIDWVGDKIAFTRNNQIWIMNSNRTEAKAITNPPRAGEIGKANLPFGDYDPRIQPDGDTVIFERLENDTSTHGNYNFFTVNIDGTDLQQITFTGYTQGLPSWSPLGNEIVFIISAINDEGKYDMHIMNMDGANERNIMPEYFPANLLLREAIFSQEETMIYFIVEWWE
jgi:Tol biopolymer transport system component